MRAIQTSSSLPFPTPLSLPDSSSRPDMPSQMVVQKSVERSQVSVAHVQATQSSWSAAG